MQNEQWLINGNPKGRPLEQDDFLKQVVSLDELSSGEVRVRVELLSFDPSQKGQMENIGYAAATEVGQVMRATGIGEVIESKVSSIAVGTKVMGSLGWQRYATLPGTQVEPLSNAAPWSAYLGPLGGTGLTAYFGLLHVGQPTPGDTVLVSGAAGATGSIVGQLARLAGCRVVGIAGGPDKCAWLVNELGFDAAIDYKNDRVKAMIRETCPSGVNVYFDNVGGSILNDALACIALNARVVICGGISRYQEAVLPPGPANYFNLVFQRASMLGFLVTDYAADFPAARDRLAKWLASGDLLYKEDIQEGFEQIPATLQRVFNGANFGKQLLRLESPD
jgi:NADPH-dependent curcumin reductase CurA